MYLYMQICTNVHVYHTPKDVVLVYVLLYLVSYAQHTRYYVVHVMLYALQQLFCITNCIHICINLHW